MNSDAWRILVAALLTHIDGRWRTFSHVPKDLLRRALVLAGRHPEVFLGALSKDERALLASALHEVTPIQLDLFDSQSHGG